jgi:light-regulated signal transduction histidine kinase (bacteriophytochrome)
MLELVMRNLLGNAWKYTARTVASISLTVSIRRPPVVPVADNGAGFDMAHADRLFKLPSSVCIVRRIHWHRCGLATVQRIVHRHVAISSRPPVPVRAPFLFHLESADHNEWHMTKSLLLVEDNDQDES